MEALGTSYLTNRGMHIYTVNALTRAYPKAHVSFLTVKGDRTPPLVFAVTISKVLQVKVSASPV